MTMTHCIWDFTALSPKVDGCEILHQLIGGESHYLYPRWCRISQPSTVCRLCRLRLTSSHPFANPLYIASPHTWVFHILNYACAKKDKTKTTLANTLRICPNTHVQCIYILSYCQVQHTKHPKISKHVQDITCPTLGKCHTKNIYESSVKAVTLFLYVVDRKPTCVVDIPPRFNTVIIGFLSPLSAEMVGG